MLMAGGETEKQARAGTHSDVAQNLLLSRQLGLEIFLLFSSLAMPYE